MGTLSFAPFAGRPRLEPDTAPVVRDELENPRHRLGRRNFYDWYRCTGCDEWVDSKQDGGRWNHNGVWCARCVPKVESIPLQRVDRQDVPAAYSMAELADVPQRAALSRWPDQEPLVGIRGVPGSGKTYAIWAMARDMARRGRVLTVLDSTRARDEWLGSMCKRELELGWTTCAWLAVDDLSSPPATDGWADLVYRVLDGRLRERRPTLVTTHSGAEEVERQYGKAVRSRLGAFRWTTLPATDRRRRFESGTSAKS